MPPSAASSGNHDYRECFYASQEDRHRAAQDCPRFPCRVYREGFADGHGAGYSAGEAAGYAEGYAAGAATSGDG